LQEIGRGVDVTESIAEEKKNDATDSTVVSESIKVVLRYRILNIKATRRGFFVISILEEKIPPIIMTQQEEKKQTNKKEKEKEKEKESEITSGPGKKNRRRGDGG
jgi:hypothetical protein